jgi:hypothetical protein
MTLKNTQYRLLFLIILLSFFQARELFGQKFNEFTFSQLPQDFQLYPRANDNFGTIAIEGVLSSNAYQSFSVRLLRNGIIKSYKKTTLQFSNGVAKFSESIKIPAELAQYGIEIFGIKNTDSTLIVRRNNIVAGDVFYVTGQSNAWIGPIDDLVYQGEWLRSFGAVQLPENYGPYNPADTLWSLATGRARIGPFAAELARLIYESEKIPIAIINSAAGGSNIDWHLKLDGNISALDGGNIMYYKAIKSKTIQRVKSIIYRQGEAEASDVLAPYTWSSKFNSLLQKYKRFFPSAQHVYNPQLTIYEYPNRFASQLREDQRVIASQNNYVRSFATLGTTGLLPDRLHYTNLGYRQTALELFRLISNQLYQRPFPIEIYSPNIQRAYFKSETERNKVYLVFEEGQNLHVSKDTVVTDNRGQRIVAKMAKYFYWDKLNANSFEPYITSIEADKNLIIITFNQNYTGNLISYMPDYHREFQTGINEYGFPGPFIKNGMGMRAFAFSGFPIIVEDKLNLDFTCYPNPGSDMIRIGWDRLATGTLEIFDMFGRAVYRENINKSFSKNIDVSRWSAANYFVQFKSSTGRTYSKRLAILH